MNNNELMSKLFGFSAPTYFRWKKENRPIIKLIEKFSEEELVEYLSSGEITRLDDIKNNKNKVFDDDDIFIDYAKIHLREKIQSYTDGSFFDWANKMIPKKYLQKILKDLSQDKERFSVHNSKNSLLDRIKGLEVSLINKKNQEQISNFIEKKLSKIECYILIQEHEDIMNYKGFWK